MHLRDTTAIYYVNLMDCIDKTYMLEFFRLCSRTFYNFDELETTLILNMKTAEKWIDESIHYISFTGSLNEACHESWRNELVFSMLASLLFSSQTKTSRGLIIWKRSNAFWLLISFPAAKEYVLNLMIKGLQLSEPCDESFSDSEFKLPVWFDEKKYERWVVQNSDLPQYFQRPRL